MFLQITRGLDGCFESFDADDLENVLRSYKKHSWNYVSSFQFNASGAFFFFVAKRILLRIGKPHLI